MVIKSAMTIMIHSLLQTGNIISSNKDFLTTNVTMQDLRFLLNWHFFGNQSKKGHQIKIVLYFGSVFSQILEHTKMHLPASEASSRVY